MKPSFKFKNSILLVVVLLIVISCTADDQDKNEQRGDSVASSPLTIISEPFNIDEYKGKKLLIAYWATWCPPCIEEAPILIDIHKKHDGDNFSVIGVSVDKSPILVEKFINKFGINYPVYIEDESLKKVFGQVFGLPTIFMVDSSGEIIEKHTGALSEDALRDAVKEFIRK